MTVSPIVFLVDVDNTLLDNDEIQNDLRRHLEREFGPACRDRYIHKEAMLDDVERRYPARHYVLIDDKLRILSAVKKAWGDRVTTVFPCQGQYAMDAKAVVSNPAADVTVERIGDLMSYELPAALTGGRPITFSAEVTR